MQRCRVTSWPFPRIEIASHRKDDGSDGSDSEGGSGGAPGGAFVVALVVSGPGSFWVVDPDVSAAFPTTSESRRSLTKPGPRGSPGKRRNRAPGRP